MKKNLSWALILVPIWIVINVNAYPFSFISTALNELYYDGLRHASKSRASLEIKEDKLVLENTGVSCEDGVDIFLGETRGFAFDLVPLDPELDAAGAQKEWIMYGEINGNPNQVLWSEVHKVTSLGEQAEITVSFDASPLGATTNFIKAYNEDGVLLYSGEFPNGPLYRYGNCCPPSIFTTKWDELCETLIPNNSTITFLDGTRFSGEVARIETGAVNPQLVPEAYNRVENWSLNAGDIILCEGRIAMFEERYYNRALGSTQFNASEQGYQLQLNNLGAVEGSGVEVNVNMAEEFCMVFAPYELNPNGQSALDFSAEAYGPNGGTIPFGKLSLVELENQNGFLVQPDFSDLPNFDPSQIIYDGITEGGEVVVNLGRGAAPLSCSSPIKAAGKLTGIGRDNPVPCFYLEWEDGNFIDFQGQTYRINKLFVRAATEVAVENMASFSVTTRNISSLTIIDEKSEIDACCQLKDCDNTVLCFDGNGDFLRTPSSPLNGTQEFTIEAWVYPQDTDGLLGCSGNFERIFGFGGNRFEIGVCGGNLSLVAGSGVGLEITAMPNDRWHHVAATRIENTLNIYLNCELVYSAETNLNIGPPLRIGSWSGNVSLSETWQGKMDEFRIWGFPKSLDELDLLKDCPLSGQEEGLLLYYKFNETPVGPGPTRAPLHDYSGNGLDATFEGFEFEAGSSVFACDSFLVCSKCIADFSWKQSDDCGTISFENLSIGTNLNYSWDFNNDGTFDSHQFNPSFQYPGPGTYTVCLKVENDGCEAITCMEVVVETEDIAPIALCKESFSLPVTEACEVALSPEMIDNGSSDNCRIHSIKIDREFISERELCQLFTVQLTVRDWVGNESTCSTMVSLIDNEAPEMTCPADIIVEAELGTGIDVTGMPIVEDNCNFFTEFTDGELGGESCPGSILRTWRAVDRCGNETLCDQQIFINCDVCVPCAESSPVNDNMITNGDFENGNTGFSSDYTYEATASLNPGDYGVRNSINLGNVQWSNKDHTNNLIEGLFLVCDGADDTNLVCYRAEVEVVEGITYTFCAYVNNVVRPQSDFRNPVLELSIGGMDLITGKELDELPDGWKLITADYTAPTSGTVSIEIRSTVIGIGVDYAIDDVSFTQCERMTTDVKPLDYLGSIQLMPNPTKDWIRISLELPSTTSLNAQLKSIDGRLMQQKKLKSYTRQMDFDLSRLPKGIYILNLVDEDGAMWTKKVVKQ